MNWWRRLSGHGRTGREPGNQRWVVVDVESSGLDPARDRLISIAGLAVRFDQDAPTLQLADSFEVILRQEEQGEGGDVDRPNILLHGIGIGAQRGGVPPREGMEAFRRWLDEAPIVGYHAAFDQTLLSRHFATHLGRRLDNSWVDLEHVVAVVVPGLRERSLDATMAHLGIRCHQRHQAAADTLATAEILLRIWPLAKAQMGGRSDFKSLQRLASRRRWLPRHGA